MHIGLKSFFSLEPNLFFTTIPLLPQPRSEFKVSEVFDHLVDVLIPLWERHVLRFGNQTGHEDPNDSQPCEDDEGVAEISGALK